jgi:hypothetical protein
MPARLPCVSAAWQGARRAGHRRTGDACLLGNLACVTAYTMRSRQHLSQQRTVRHVWCLRKRLAARAPR